MVRPRSGRKRNQATRTTRVLRHLVPRFRLKPDVPGCWPRTDMFIFALPLKGCRPLDPPPYSGGLPPAKLPAGRAAAPKPPRKSMPAKGQLCGKRPESGSKWLYRHHLCSAAMWAILIHVDLIKSKSLARCCSRPNERCPQRAEPNERNPKTHKGLGPWMSPNPINL